MENKLFKKRDEGFICSNCGEQVLPLGETSRNHCPFCLHSLHVDINPGDRMNGCGGLMTPVDILEKRGGYVIIHKCLKCGEVKRNKAVCDAKVQPDSFDEMLKIKERTVKGI